jgi:hypothetical protein
MVRLGDENIAIDTALSLGKTSKARLSTFN